MCLNSNVLLQFKRSRLPRGTVQFWGLIAILIISGYTAASRKTTGNGLPGRAHGVQPGTMPVARPASTSNIAVGVAGAAAAATDIVLYASEGIGPNWSRVADATAAGGFRLSNPDLGAAKLTTPLAGPSSYFEMAFSAPAVTRYHLWIRGKAQNDSPYNDSVFVQFSDSLDTNGVAAYRIGTTDATTINLEDCFGCGLSGWGWQDNGWGSGVLGPDLAFQNSGTHTIRIQVREDGLSIDQIVLSPSTYLNTSPGAIRNDTTILPRSGAQPPPSLESVSPDNGSAAGGTPVTITGSGFASGASAKFGGVSATAVTVVSPTTLTAITPAHAAGTVGVTVTNVDGQSGTLAGGFSYNQPSAMPRIGHTFIVVEENHSYSSVIGSSAMPYLNSLASRYGLATNYFANTHPSIGNYFWLTTGQVITNDSNFTGTVTADNIVRQLLAAGKTWKSYAESLPFAGYTGSDQYPYAKRHNPFAYLSDVTGSATQVNNVVPFSQFAGDLANNRLPNYSFIVPNLLNDAHDCPSSSPSCTDADMLARADSWLATNIAPLLASAVFQQDGLLVIVFDESVDSDTAGGGGHVAMVVISPRAKPGYQSSSFYQHQSTLRMMAEALGLTSFPGDGANAPSMSEFFDTTNSPTPSVGGVSPNTGPASGGTSITITGSAFAPGATVFLSGIPATNVNVESSTWITGRTPAHSAGSANVTVTNTNGRSGTLTNGFTYTSSNETILLADDFNDGALDTSKWLPNNLFSGFTDSSVSAVESSQRFNIGPLKLNSTGSHYNGIVSSSSFVFSGGYCYVQLVQAPAANTTGDAMFTIGKDVNNYYRFYVEAGSLFLQKRINGSKAALLTMPYSAVNHSFLRIRHDPSSSSVLFEAATNAGGTPSTWTVLYSEPWSSSVSLSSIVFEIKGGTWQPETNAPGSVTFDNFKAAKP
jgi:acid phosphatase